MSIILNSNTYNWSGFDSSGVSRWTYTGAGVASAFANLTERVTIGSLGGGGNTAVVPKSTKVKWRLATPVIATEASACACVGEVLRTSYIEVNGSFAPNATVAERTADLAALRDLVLTTEFESSFLGLVQSAG